LIMTQNKDNGTSGTTTGAVLVVGAGIGGMQASLDLADSGFKVYLADKSPAIGGIMAQLDKTFPTNDCSMCIMSPKLVEVGRHLNVDIMTMSEVESIGGSAGDFTVTLRRKARYVDVAKCTGCGDCEGVCPISLPDQFNEGLSERRAAFKLYPQAIPNAFALEKVGTAPCRDACPIDQRAQGYIALIREGRFADAYRTIKEENPFPSICGRVCNHRCEDACNRGKVDAPLNIMGLKRFVADWAAAHPDEIQAVMPEILQEPNGKRVAIVGSGPAGLTAALDLTRMGYETTVLEAQPVPGGMMRIGVPGYRLPHDVVQREIAEIVAAGVDIKLNHRVDDMAALLHGGYHAVLIAVGAHDGIALPIPGADSPDVHVATDFLRCASLGEPLDVQGKRVLVIGGGNVAVDSAQTAVRTGASWVGMSCLESRETMPAHDWEIEGAQEEGIEVFPSRTFREIVVVGGQVTGVRCVQVDFRGFVDGRPDFDEIPDTEQVLPADIVIFAIGQRPDLSGVPDGIDMFRGRFLASDRETMATNIPGVFAAGDVVTGTSFIVDAIAAGHKAAHSIHSYLSTGEPSTWQSANPSQMVVELSPDEAQAKLVADEAISSGPRAELPKLSAAERTDSFVEVYGGFTEAEAMAEAQRCLICGVCSECNQCFYACKAEAIDHYQKDELVEVKVGAVVLAPGLKPVEGTIRPEFGYGHYANVVTSLEFERMLSASGPFAGEVKRPSDGRHPVKVAFIQCVGSRDTSCGNGYCSSVCCMYATKEAVIAKEHDAHIEPAIFYMDIRAFGKGFEQYIDRAKDEHGVRYVRSMVSSVREVPGTGNLRVQYALFDRAQSAPRVVEEEFDLVVLSVGLKPADGTFEMSQRLGLELNSYGFCEAEPFCPTLTNRPGIYVAGGFGEPKDIPETVIEASSAAAAASCLLADSRGSLTRQMVYPEERDISEEETKVGVFVCHCGINIGGVVKVPEVVEYVKTLPNVVYAEHNLYTCSQDTQEKITEVVKEKGLNRVVVASCTPRTHEPLFQDTIRQAGLNPHLFELANIREQDSWVHRELGREVATEKAKDLVRMAVAKASRLRPIQRLAFEVNHRALVVGGGLAGMMAALTVADQGFDVVLLEREGELGGNLRHIYTGFDGSDPQGLLSDTIRRIGENERISVLLNAELRQVSGYVGAFESRVRQADGTWHDLKHGAIIIATGGREIEPSEYGYGTLPGVMTQRQYEQLIRGGRSAESQEGPNSVVMIQCVGSRDEAHPYCSRICCSEAIKNALETKRRNPSAEVAILYRDIRTFGFKEDLYREARASGVLFLQYDPENKPTVQSQNGRLAVQVAAQPEGEVVTLPADVLVLSAGIEPLPENEELAQLVKVPLDQDGFFLEAHVKLRPLDFAADGVYLCGLAHSPRFIDESIAQAKGAAIRAVTLLAKEKLDATAITAEVNPRLCSACGICVDTCPYNARIIPEDDGYYAHVIDVLCQGCGACIVACPNGATQQKGFEFKQIFSVIDAALASA
jgi:heterodisulfide reductase subunit A-like polyferredoxin